MGTVASREVVGLVQLGLFDKVKSCPDNNKQYYEMFDKTDPARMELLKPRPFIKHVELLFREDMSHCPLR